MTSAIGGGMLLAAIDYRGIAEDEFHQWYDDEHIPERLAVPGFLAARRYLSADGARFSLVVYELEDVSVLRSDSYLAISGDNFSPWSKRVLGRCREFDRYELTLASAHGNTRPSANAVLMMAMSTLAGRDEQLRRWLDSRHVERALAVPGVEAVRHYTRRADAGPHGHVVLHYLEDPDVVYSPGWGERLGFLPGHGDGAFLRGLRWNVTVRYRVRPRA